MRRIALPGLMVALCCGVIAAEEKKPALDPAKLVGTWAYVSGVDKGEAVPKEKLVGVVTFTKDTVTVPAAPGQKFVMGYTVDTKASPAAIDLDIKESPGGEKGKAVGIIALEGDTLKLAYIPVAGDAKRPTKFESAKDSGVLYFTLTKAKVKAKE